MLLVGVDGILLFVCDWMFVKDERVWMFLLEVCWGGVFGDDGGWGLVSEEVLERCW